MATQKLTERSFPSVDAKTVAATWLVHTVDPSGTPTSYKEQINRLPVFVQGGNSFGADGNLGTNDNFNLIIKTNNLERGRVTNAGLFGFNETNPGARVHIRSSAGQSPLRVDTDTLNNALLVDSNGRIGISESTLTAIFTVKTTTTTSLVDFLVKNSSNVDIFKVQNDGRCFLGANFNVLNTGATALGGASQTGNALAVKSLSANTTFVTFITAGGANVFTFAEQSGNGVFRVIGGGTTFHQLSAADGRAYLGSPSSSPTDGNIGNNQITFWLDEVANKLMIRLKYAAGTLKTGEINLT